MKLHGTMIAEDISGEAFLKWGRGSWTFIKACETE